MELRSKHSSKLWWLHKRALSLMFYLCEILAGTPCSFYSKKVGLKNFLRTFSLGCYIEAETVLELRSGRFSCPMTCFLLAEQQRSAPVLQASWVPDVIPP